MKERELRKRNFVATRSILSRQGNVKNQSARRVWIKSGNNDDRACLRGKAEIGQPHFTGLGVHPGCPALPVRVRASASGRARRSPRDRSPRQCVHALQQRSPASKCAVSRRVFPSLSPFAEPPAFSFRYREPRSLSASAAADPSPRLPACACEKSRIRATMS